MNIVIGVFLFVAIIGGVSSGYLWRLNTGLTRHAFISIELAFALGIIYALSTWLFALSLHWFPVILLFILTVISLYMSIVAIDHWIKHLDEKGRKESEKTYQKRLGAIASGCGRFNKGV